MNLNQEVDKLDQAVKRNDVDEAVIIDTRLAMYEKQLMDGLTAMPREHAETMGFYFREWIMNCTHEIIYGLMITISFIVDHTLASFFIGGTGAILLLSSIISRRKYAEFYGNDIKRMCKEKMIADNYKLQLNFVRSSRMEHSEYLDGALQDKLENNGDMSSVFSRLFQPPQDEDTDLENVDEKQEDTDKT